jgi:hypothetical protein
LLCTRLVCFLYIMPVRSDRHRPSRTHMPSPPPFSIRFALAQPLQRRSSQMNFTMEQGLASAIARATFQFLSSVVCGSRALRCLDWRASRVPYAIQGSLLWLERSQGPWCVPLPPPPPVTGASQPVAALLGLFLALSIVELEWPSVCSVARALAPTASHAQPSQCSLLCCRNQESRGKRWQTHVLCTNFGE